MFNSWRYLKPLDLSGNPHYYVTDWQGNNIGVVDRNGLLEEGTRSGGLNDYRFPARDYVPGFPRFTTIDPMCEKTPWLSPYVYCAGNPVMYTDPTGAEIRGQSKDDARKIAEDLNEIFRADEFVGFRELIKVDGKKISAISEMDLNAAFDGIQLSEDQLALVDIVVNTINSKDRHMVEYKHSRDRISSYGEKVIINDLVSAADNPKAIFDMIDMCGGLSASVALGLGGGTGITKITSNGSYSLIALEGNYPIVGRCVTTGHELFGHGRPLTLGRNYGNLPDVDAVQTENLIIRVMGYDTFTNGVDHGGPFDDYYLIPGFR